MNAKTGTKAWGISRDGIKYLAVITMAINHIANSLIQEPTVLYYVMTCIGYFTAPVMCYFLVEGFHHTRSVKKYAVRLLIFAILSQIPYEMAFAADGILHFRNLNMIFTLLICLGIVVAMNYVSSEMERFVIIFALVMMSLGCDWAISAPVFVILFERFRGSRRNMLMGFALAALEEGMLYAFSMGAGEGMCFLEALGWALAGCAGTIAAGIMITFLYNGEKGEHSGKISRWFFYVFYPLHLLILGVIRIYVKGM